MLSGIRYGVAAVCLLTLLSTSVQAAYHHGADTDSELVTKVYPQVAGTKLDSCALCHSGGEYEKKPGLFIEMGSCQWCHYSYGYDQSGDIDETMNGYGKDYRDAGRNEEALEMIADDDSDGDGFSNIVEIQALRYPGDADDDPTKVAAPYKVVTLAELEGMLSHSQLMLMNTHKSGDFYAEYTGVPMTELLAGAKMLEYATGITVYAPDGWAQYHPLEEDGDPLMYHVLGGYPQAQFYYDSEAEFNEDGTEGWCSYDSPAIGDLQHGELIEVPGGLKMILAYKRDGAYLDPGVLTLSNKLDGEGPFRVVPPQKIPGPPDQSVKADNQDVIWPFDDYADHNAGFSTRSATVIKVEPLPPGTTDVDLLEAGWSYVDQGKILIYGAIDPTGTVLAILDEVQDSLANVEEGIFKNGGVGNAAVKRLRNVARMVERGAVIEAADQLASLMQHFDGCVMGGIADKNDWLPGCDFQSTVYWQLYEVKVLLPDGE